MSPNKLSDKQLVLLSAAAQHPQRAVEVAADLKGEEGLAMLLAGQSIDSTMQHQRPADVSDDALTLTVPVCLKRVGARCGCWLRTPMIKRRPIRVYSKSSFALTTFWHA